MFDMFRCRYPMIDNRRITGIEVLNSISDLLKDFGPELPPVLQENVKARQRILKKLIGDIEAADAEENFDTSLELDDIPEDFVVQPLKPGQDAEDKVTCGHCGLSWDDAIPTGYTPTPAARCPFEAFHNHYEE